MTTPYTAAARFKRTPEEKADQMLAWNRPDQAFFAAGACHVLAWTAKGMYGQLGFAPVGMRKVDGPWASHVVLASDRWAFDHDGWTPRSELMEATAAHEPATPWEWVELPESIEEFCAEHNSRLPSGFAYDPVPRALEYIRRHPKPSWVE
jgi:hypothetical protein